MLIDIVKLERRVSQHDIPIGLHRISWSSKGYNVGPWTPDNEDWFLGRFKSYAKGEGRLHTIDKWSKKMKGIKDSVTMMNTLNSQCATFIGS